MTELEAALLSIASKLGTTSNTPSTDQTDTDAAKTLTSLRAELAPPTPAESSSVSSPACRLENAPVLSLFDNSILSRHQDEESTDDQASDPLPNAKNASDQFSKIESTRRTLLSLFPTQKTLDAIRDASLSWWQASQGMFPFLLGPQPGHGAQEFIADLRASGNVQALAKALLFVCIGLQEAPPGSELCLEPSVTAASLSAHYLGVIYDLVISDEELVGTIDGIECLFLYYKHDVNDGRMRRAWVNIRRALSFAQLLGLHTHSRNGRPPANPASLRGDSLWKALYQSDRFLSLLLGLPYAVSELPSAASGQKTGDENYLFRLCHIIGHIIDRNQEPPNNNTLPFTVKIESELTDLAESMPSDWWESESANLVTERLYGSLMPQFWHHQARTLLHLPFMLKAATDRRYEYSRIATLESAREMLQRYLRFRPDMGFGSQICKVIDFQVFTAAMVLVLNLLSTSTSSPARDQEEAAMDEKLIEKTHDLLHRASLETDAGVTNQAARALKNFCKARRDPCPPGRTSMRIVIPYFGAVVFGPGKNLTNQAYLKCPYAENQPAQLPTPDMEQIDSVIQDPSDFQNLWATMPSDLNLSGYQLQQPEASGDGFANVNVDLDQDWSWFWNNTTMV